MLPFPTPCRFTFEAGDAEMDIELLLFLALAAGRGEAKPSSPTLARLMDAGLLDRVRRATGGEGVWAITGDVFSAAPGTSSQGIVACGGG